MLDIISKQIHEAAVDRAAKYLVAEAEPLAAIIEVDRHKLYEKFDEPYLTPYCVKYLNLSEDVSAMFVRVARKSQQVPELELAVQAGLQISKAKTIASVIDKANKDHSPPVPGPVRHSHELPPSSAPQRPRSLSQTHAGWFNLRMQKMDGDPSHRAKGFGGEDTVENLITLCKSHHRQLHELRLTDGFAGNDRGVCLGQYNITSNLLASWTSG